MGNGGAMAMEVGDVEENWGRMVGSFERWCLGHGGRWVGLERGAGMDDILGEGQGRGNHLLKILKN